MKAARRSVLTVLGGMLLLGSLALVSCNRQGSVREAALSKDVFQQAYVYGFPMIMSYKIMYQFNIDKTSAQYKGPINQMLNEPRVFTSADTAVVMPNSDTPYSFAQMDLRAEPMVVCAPKIEKDRYYSIMFVDMYTFNFAIVGTGTTGNEPGCFMVSGPGWKGETPAGIKKAFSSETQFALALIRTQLFSAADLANVKKIQAGYKLESLSAFVHKPAPPAAPAIDFPTPSDTALTTDFSRYLNFLLQFCPPVPEEAELRAKFATVGIEAGKPFDAAKLTEQQRKDLADAVQAGHAAIAERVRTLGTDQNGWRVGSAFGDRKFFNSDFLLRAAAAMAGIWGLDASEAVYPLTAVDSTGQPLDASKHNYTITFAAGEYPPVRAFWSLTMYDATTQLLVANPIDRYLINSTMMSSIKKNKDGSFTIYMQKDAPAGEAKANWLPAPNGPFKLALRLYLPRETPPPSILPLGSGSWKPPAVTVIQ